MPIGTARAARRGRLPVAIPDSEADQKLVHRWYLGATDPFVDQVGSSDATNSGTTETTGSWVDEAARSGDGVDDYVNLGPIPLSTLMGSDGMAFAFSIKTTDDAATAMGENVENENTIVRIPVGNAGSTGVPANKLGLQLRDQSSNEVIVNHATDVNDGNPHRGVINITDPSGDASSVDIYLDQTENTVIQTNNTLSGSFANFTDLLSHALNNFGAPNPAEYINATIDDICIFDSPLTATEAQRYTNPWS